MRTGNRYSTAVDLWALGAVIHEILTSQIPFLDTYQEMDIDMDSTPFTGEIGPQLDTQMLYGYCNGLDSFPIQCLEKSGVREEGIAFVKGLMAANPADRVSAKDALNSLLLIRGLCTAVVRTEPNGLEPLHARETDSRPPIVPRPLDQPEVISPSRSPAQNTLPPANLPANRPPRPPESLDVVKVDRTSATDPVQRIRDALLSLTPEAQNPFATGDQYLIQSILNSAEKGRRRRPRKAVPREIVDFALFFTQYIKHDINETGRCRSLLQVAAGEGRLPVVKLLLNSRANVNLASGPGPCWTALQAATEGGHHGAMKLLLKAGAEVKDAPGTSRTLLQIAAARGDLDALHILFENNADVNVTPESGGTVLKIAAKHGHIGAAQLFLDKGVDIDLVGRRGHAALYIAISHNQVDFVRFLLDRNAKVTANMVWAAFKRPHMKALLQEYGHNA